MSSPNRPAVKSQITKGQADITDSNYAETVYRTVMGPDGRVKEQYIAFMVQLMIDQTDIFD